MCPQVRLQGILRCIFYGVFFTAHFAAHSTTPTLRGGAASGLLVERPEGRRTAESFAALTGGADEYAAWQQFYGELEQMAGVLAPTFLSPLPTERDLQAQVGETIWRDVVERPLGEAVERRFRDDTVRGVVGTDGLIGTFASLHDASLVQNKCFLYHLVGNGTGDHFDAWCCR